MKKIVCVRYLFNISLPAADIDDEHAPRTTVPAIAVIATPAGPPAAPYLAHVTPPITAPTASDAATGCFLMVQLLDLVG